MKLRIDLKIFIFLLLFYFTNQLKLYLIMIFFSIIHELGHLLIGLVLKMKIEKIEIKPYGLSISFNVSPKDVNIKINKGNLLALKKIMISLAGPIVSLCIASIYLNVEPYFLNKEYIVYSNLLILLFNLLPIYPLDGARILNGILHIEFGNKIALILTNKISNIVIIILTIISSIAIYYYKNIAIFLICIVLWIITLQENKKFNINMMMYEILGK